MKRVPRTFALVLILCCIGACIVAGWSMRWQFSQSDRMIQALVESQAGQVESLELVSQREWNKKLVVIFTFQRRAEGNRLVECLGYAMLERADQAVRIARSHINPFSYAMLVAVSRGALHQYGGNDEALSKHQTMPSAVVLQRVAWMWRKL